MSLLHCFLLILLVLQVLLSFLDVGLLTASNLSRNHYVWLLNGTFYRCFCWLLDILVLLDQGCTVLRELCWLRVALLVNVGWWYRCWRWSWLWSWSSWLWWLLYGWALNRFYFCNRLLLLYSLVNFWLHIFVSWVLRNSLLLLLLFLCTRILSILNCLLSIIPHRSMQLVL